MKNNGIITIWLWRGLKLFSEPQLYFQSLWFLSTRSNSSWLHSLENGVTCLYGEEPLSVSGQSLPAFLMPIFFFLWGLMVTSSFSWPVIKLFFLFLCLDSAYSEWLEVGCSWGILTKLRWFHNLSWYILMKTSILPFANIIDGVITATDLQDCRKIFT